MTGEASVYGPRARGFGAWSATISPVSMDMSFQPDPTACLAEVMRSPRMGDRMKCAVALVGKTSCIGAPRSEYSLAVDRSALLEAELAVERAGRFVVLAGDEPDEVDAELRARRTVWCVMLPPTNRGVGLVQASLRASEACE